MGISYHRLHSFVYRSGGGYRTGCQNYQHPACCSTTIKLICMSILKIVGIIALVLGMVVLMVAGFVSFRDQKFVLEPFFLGGAAILAGLLSLKKSKE